MGECWSGLSRRLGNQKGSSDGKCLVEMEMGLADSTDPEQLSQADADKTTKKYCLNHQRSAIGPKALTSKLKRFKEKKLNRGISSKAFGSGKPGNYSIFDSPGSDRFHFGDGSKDQNNSAHGSIVSLEWDSQDCYKDLLDRSPSPHLTINPLSLSHPSITAHTAAPDNPLVSLNSTTCTAVFSSRQAKEPGEQTRSAAVSCDSLLWNTGHDRQGQPRSAVASCDSLLWDTGIHTKHQDLQEVDCGIYDKETETLLNEIEDLTSQALRETNRWNIQVNQMTEDDQSILYNRESDDSEPNLNCDTNINPRKCDINRDQDTLNQYLSNQKKSQFGEISSICTDTPSPMSISADSANLGSI
eukprot:TRINITY_DN25259_c0_g1_i1.p1 TRINITY_DN25259_c0_g1~~TRINITY_DN25259_c0_g1_i1.p1  ORF type:complete len:357 (-),score=61.37 TRINITY_DN25259_c0_g1_i1:192-1262(-)